MVVVLHLNLIMKILGVKNVEFVQWRELVAV